MSNQTDIQSAKPVVGSDALCWRTKVDKNQLNLSCFLTKKTNTGFVETASNSVEFSTVEDSSSDSCSIVSMHDPLLLPDGEWLEMDYSTESSVKVENYNTMSKVYCLLYCKGECKKTESECGKVHPDASQLDLVVKLFGFVHCTHNDKCPWVNCIYYHTGPAAESVSRHIPRQVWFPFYSIPYDRVETDYYKFVDPVLKLQKVNARRQEVGAMCMIDLHYQKASHVYYLLDQVLADNTHPIKWETEKNAKYLWISTGIGFNSKVKYPGNTDLRQTVQDYLERNGIEFDFSHVGYVVGGFRLRLNKKYTLQ